MKFEDLTPDFVRPPKCVTIHSVARLFWMVICLGFASNQTTAQMKTDFLMSREPEEKVQPVKYVLPPELIPLWKKALLHPESEIQRQAAEAIVRAHRLGHVEVESTALELRAIVVSPKSHPATRFAAAHALIAMDQRNTATTLFEISKQEGKDLRQLIEPALAHWNFEPIRDEWHHRIANIATPRRDLILAINGVGEEHDVAAIDDLLHLTIVPEQPADIRLAAARALGRIATQGQEKHAEQLLATQGSALGRLCALAIIARHRSEEAIRLQTELAKDPEAAVVAEALRSLFANDPKLVMPLADQSLTHPDANVRRIAIQTYVALPTPERIRSLAKLLNDPHPQLRTLIRESFSSLLSDPTLHEPLCGSTIAILNADDWRGQEQAALFLGAIDQQEVAPRLLELLESPRPEVMVASAWALKSIADPETASAVLDVAQRRSEGPEGTSIPIDFQVAHLFELLGKLKTFEAVPVLSKYIPKSAPYGEASRSAAIWALGLIFEGQPNDELARQLMLRIQDTKSLPPESTEVRRTSALTIGRLKGNSHLRSLKEIIGEKVDNDPVELALRWAVLRISGEALPILPPTALERRGWFLEPVQR